MHGVQSLDFAQTYQTSHRGHPGHLRELAGAKTAISEHTIRIFQGGEHRIAVPAAPDIDTPEASDGPRIPGVGYRHLDSE